MECAWCETKQCTKYSHIKHVGLLCERCKQIILDNGPLLFCLQEFLNVPTDADPQVVDIQKKVILPLSIDEFFFWVGVQGKKKPDIKDRCHALMIERKIQFKLNHAQPRFPFANSYVQIEMGFLKNCAMYFPPRENEDENLLIIREPEKVILGLANLWFSEKGNDFAKDVVKQMKVCAQCADEGDFTKSCPRCGKSFYCSRQCQKLHWKKHKKLCFPL